MKLKLLFILPGFFVIQSAFSQTSHVTLSDQYPAAGETISINYCPAGTPLEKEENINASVYYLDNKDYPVSEIILTPGNKSLKGRLTIPATAKAFYIKLSSEDVVDNNNGAGYVYLVYDKDQKPVTGAYAEKASMLSNGMGAELARIKKISNEEALALYQEEFDLYPSTKSNYDQDYYRLLARTNNASNLAIVNNKISMLEKSGTEKDLQLARLLFRVSDRKNQYDSLTVLIKTRYPNGAEAKFDMFRTFLMARNAASKDSIYIIFTQKYPGDELQDNLASQLAALYLEKDDMANYEKYAAQVKNKLSLTPGLNGKAKALAEKGERLDEAEKLSKQSLVDVQAAIDNPVPMPFRTLTEVKVMHQKNYDTYADTYAYILLKEDKPAEALKYQQRVHDHNKDMDATKNEHYILILNALGKYTEAQKIAEATIKENKSSAGIKDALKTDYIKIKGSDKDYDKYLAALENTEKDKALADLAKTMINTPAPLFTLKDIDGNAVSLSDLKGKVVIVDFWATWCGPCKASFPGMQMAVNKYKDDPNVKFLFVDCWETADNYADGVKKFIAENGYTFHVLLDEKTSNSRQAKVANFFDVSGIPTKFIIDKAGNIRFKYIGYDGTAKALADEVSNMIDMVNDPKIRVSDHVQKQ
jgi:peroxiredoxin